MKITTVMPLLAGGHQRGGEWGRRRGDPAGEGVQTALVIFLIFTLQATVLDVLAAFDEDVRFKSVKRKRR